MPDYRRVEAGAFSLSPKVMCGLFMFTHFCLTLEDGFFPTVLVEVMTYFNLSYVTGGILGTGYYMGICIGTPYFGYIANVTKPVRIMLCGMLIWEISVAILFVCDEWYWVLIGKFTMGVGKAALVSISPVIIDLIADPSKRSTSIAMYFGAGPIGFALGHILGGLIVDNSWLYFPDVQRWRLAYMFQGIMGVFGVLIFACIKGPKNILALRPYEELEETQQLCIKLKKILSNWTWLFCTAAFAVQNFIISGSGYYLIQYMMDIYNKGATTSGIILGLLTLFSIIIGNIVGGTILDKILEKRKQTNEIEMCTTAIFVSLVCFIWMSPGVFMVFTSELWVFCIVLFFAMIFLWMGSGPLNSAILWSVELQERAFSRSLSNIAQFLFGYAPSPIILAALMESEGWIWTMFFTFCLPVLLIIFLVIAYLMNKRAIAKYRKDCNTKYETTGNSGACAVVV